MDNNKKQKLYSVKGFSYEEIKGITPVLLEPVKVEEVTPISGSVIDQNEDDKKEKKARSVNRRRTVIVFDKHLTFKEAKDLCKKTAIMHTSIFPDTDEETIKEKNAKEKLMNPVQEVQLPQSISEMQMEKESNSNVTFIEEEQKPTINTSTMPLPITPAIPMDLPEQMTIELKNTNENKENKDIEKLLASNLIRKIDINKEN